jgi:uncharacterized protein (TIGR01777 family)
MNILITGGSGFIGRALTRELTGSGHTVIITTRRRSDAKDTITWNPPSLIPANVLTDIDAIINLAGESIASGRWTEERKKRILSSRIETTRVLVESVRNLKRKPRVFISSSAIGYYGAHEDEPLTEDTPAASDFLADVCMQWEAEALKAEEFGIRVVLIRTGGVLETDGGALPAMAIPFRFFAGGPIGSGKQWFSWIHMDDEVGIIKFALEHDSISGPVNATAPNPVTNREFSSALGKALGRPSCLAVPGFIVKLTLGELGEVLLAGQRVIPEKVLQAGYRFKYTDVNEALRAIYRKKQSE